MPRVKSLSVMEAFDTPEFLETLSLSLPGETLSLSLPGETFEG
jgi:hypothetical protein